jgi:hypothetical protein
MNAERAPKWQITARAIDYYRRMRTLDPDTNEEYWELHDCLRAELRAPPWIFPLTCDSALVAMLEAAIAGKS